MLFMAFFFFKQKTAYEVRISDWSSDVCSSDLAPYLGRLERIQALSELLSDRYGNLRIRAIGAACRRAAMVCPPRRLAFQSGQSCLSSCALIGLRHAPHARAIPQ